MRSFREHVILSELFGQPHKFLRKSVQSGSGTVTYHYSIGDGSGSTADELSVMFFRSAAPGDDPAIDWDVNFYRGGSTALTGEGDAPRVFASVLDAVKMFIRDHSPKSLAFGASKNELDQKTMSYRTGSRVKLYRKLIGRFAPTMGYALDPELSKKFGGSRAEVFVLVRKKP